MTHGARHGVDGPRASDAGAHRARRRRSRAALTFAVTGGIVTLALLLAGLGLAAPAIGLTVTLGLAAAVASSSDRPGAWLHLLGYSFAFTLLSWPVLLLGWLLVASLLGAGHWE